MTIKKTVGRKKKPWQSKAVKVPLPVLDKVLRVISTFKAKHK